MVSTNAAQARNGKPKKNGKRGKAATEGRRERGRPAVDAGAVAPTPGAQTAPTATSARAPAKVGAAPAGRRIRAIADVSESLDVRRRLRRLARQIERGTQDMQHMTFIEGAIGDSLDEAAAAPADRERWLLCEAATWGLAWMARTRRAGGSAGGLLERLVKFARTAQPGLAAGETLSARFVLTLARLFSDIEACRCLDGDAATAVADEIRRLVSAEGTVSLRGSPTVVERVVRWCLVRDLALATGSLPWDQATEATFTKSLSAAVRLLGGQGRLLVGPGRLPAAFSDPLLAAAADADRKRLRRTAEMVQTPARSGGRRSDDEKRRKLLPRDLHDAAAAVAIIRSGWDRNAIRVLLEYRDTVPHLEIAVGDRLLVDGAWQWRASQGGDRLEAEGPWTVSCWESDRKATYLEIVAPLSGGLQIDRQIVLLPRDGVVLLADAVTRRAVGAAPFSDPPRSPDAAGGLRLEAVVPLAGGLEGRQAEDTREIMVHDTKPRLLVLPLALPEWKTAGRGGFAVTADGLALDHQSAGGRCYSPLWLDFETARQGRPLTWRQLTVADTRQNLPPQQAAGFRIQEGPEQWLVYRALDEPRNRTVLGCNISCGSLIGRIGRTGVVDRLIEIH